MLQNYAKDEVNTHTQTHTHIYVIVNGIWYTINIINIFRNKK